MADSDFSIRAIIEADTSSFQNNMKSISKQMDNTSSKVQQIGKSLAKTFMKGGVIMTGIHLATKAVKGLSDQIKKGIKLNEESQQKQKLLAQTLKVTGAEAWTTVDALNSMAQALQDVTNYTSDEVTEMQTLLLGFKNITGDNFKEAQDAILDMATVMNMDLTSATQTVAKALDDPIKGLGSLQRQGFAFSESQKQMLEDMIAVGDMAGAQKVILDELNTTYGGAAKAGAKSTTQLKNNWSDLLKEMGRNVSLDFDIEPAVKKINTLVKKWKDFLNETANVKEKTDEVIKAQAAVEEGTATDEQLVTALKYQIELYETNLRTYEEMLDVDYAYYSKLLKTEGLEVSILKSRMVAAQKRIEKAKEEKNIEDENKKKLEEQAAREQTINNLKERYNEIIEKQVQKWNLIEKVTGEAVDEEEKLKFYQEQLVAIMEESNGEITEQNQYYKDQIKIIEQLKEAIAEKSGETSDEWAEKLRQQTLERLKAQKEAKLQELETWGATEKTKYQITKEYNDKIYALELKGLEREKQIALESIKGTANEEEEKRNLIDYYMNKQNDLMQEYGTQYVQGMGETGSQMGQIFGQMFGSEVGSAMDNELGVMLMVMQKVGEEMKKVFAKVGEFIKNVFQKAVNFARKLFSGFKNNLTKLFDFNPDEALDGLLKFEDKVLTFFIETLPKLPAFFESALQSISVMLSTIKLNIDKSKVKKLMKDLMQTIKKYLPDIVRTGLEIAREIIDGFAQGIAENKDAIGEVLDMLVNIIAEYLPDIILKIIDAISMFISTIKPETLVALVDAFVNLAKNICIAVIDNAVMIAEKLIPALFEVMTELFKKFPEILKTVLWEAIKGLGKVAETIWNVVKDRLGFANGTNDAPRGLAMVGEAGPELVDFRGGERVINNRNTQKLLANQGNGGNVFNVTFENTVDTTAFAMMKQLKQYQRNLAFNGVL